ncbi:MAG TPA: hypothetical protein DDX19_00095, partial [Rhodopirellula baltica]|nr:hypothetical protein [Rhodopirellula baltica]
MSRTALAAVSQTPT